VRLDSPIVRRASSVDLVADVAFLAYFTTLATTCSIIQQIHIILYWNDIMTERFWYARAHGDSAELTLTNVSLGLDRVLFYIRKDRDTAKDISVMLILRPSQSITAIMSKDY
jgi:hypothetical protein